MAPHTASFVFLILVHLFLFITIQGCTFWDNLLKNVQDVSSIGVNICKLYKQFDRDYLSYIGIYESTRGQESIMITLAAGGAI